MSEPINKDCDDLVRNPGIEIKKTMVFGYERISYVYLLH